MAIYSGFSHKKWWLSIAMLVHQRVCGISYDSLWHQQFMGRSWCKTNGGYLIAIYCIVFYRGDDQQIYTNVIFNGLLCWDSFQSFFREPNIWNHPGSYDYELRLHPSRGEPTLPAGTWLQSLAVLWSTRSVLGALHGHWCSEMSQLVQGCSGLICLYHLSVIFDIHNIYIYIPVHWHIIT